MLSLCELERAAGELERRIEGHRIQGIVQPDAHSVVLETWGGGGPDSKGRRQHVLLSCHPESARVCAVEGLPRAPATPPRFAQLLRARIGRARIGGVELVGGDRQLRLGLEAREGRFALLLAIFGRRSNVYLLDAEDRIVEGLRPLAQTRAELQIGEPWRSPASTVPRRGEDRFGGVRDEELLEAIAAVYTETERESAFGALRRRIEQAFRKEARTLDRKIERLEAELAQAQEATGLERRGELLKGVLSRVKRGDERVVARDHATGEDVDIPLDPTLSPGENLDRIFKRYQKAVRTLTKGGAQSEAVRASRDALSALEAELVEVAGGDEDEDLAALEAFAERAEVARLLGKYAPAPAPGPRERARELKVGKRVVPAKFVPRRYRTAGDLEIWVGRSDAGNDYLSTRLARGKDLFFHLDGAPGSHVILRTEGRSDPPSEAVLDACELAVHFSKQKKATRADVHVVPIKNVKKPKGSKPGLVMVHGGKSIHLRRTPARLERLLASRIEE